MSIISSPLSVERPEPLTSPSTFLVFEDRLSDSPFVERVWKSRSERAGQFLSVAEGRCEMAITRYRGRAFLTVRGPETRMTTADCPAEGEWLWRVTWHDGIAYGFSYSVFTPGPTIEPSAVFHPLACHKPRL